MINAMPAAMRPEGPAQFGATSPRGEVAMSARDFDRICHLIRQRAGIALDGSRKTVVHGRLARRLRATGKISFEDYLDALEGSQSGEWQAFVNALTTHLTVFFREPHHFPVLAAHLGNLRHQARINVWCCAASTGEEPYSIAITALQALGGSAARLRILGTDTDTSVLDAAQAATYREDSVAQLDPELVRRYFQPGASAGFVRVRPEVASRVTFRALNLLAPAWPMRPGFDVIFCRDVLIHFDKETQFSLLRRFAPLLNPGGRLFVGHAETFSQVRDTFRLLGKTVYEVNPEVAYNKAGRVDRMVRATAQ